jgi:hypothetical protein
MVARPVLFIDLAGTLELADPQTRRWGLWPGAIPVLTGLAADFELHLTTGDHPFGARQTLADLGLAGLFTGIHADLPGSGKPFGAIAADLGRDPALCLAMGDNPVSDTAGDTDRVVSLLLDHRHALVTPERAAAVIRRLAADGSFRDAFDGLAGEAGDGDQPGRLPREILPSSDLAPGCRLGWWHKSAGVRRPVVLLSGPDADQP